MLLRMLPACVLARKLSRHQIIKLIELCCLFSMLPDTACLLCHIILCPMSHHLMSYVTFSMLPNTACLGACTQAKQAGGHACICTYKID